MNAQFIDPHRVSAWQTFVAAFVYCDTVTIRAILMVASLGQAIAFVAASEIMEGLYMRALREAGPDLLWAALYALHAALQWWRFRSGPNLWLGFAVNLYGFVLWAFTTMLALVAARAMTPGSMLEWTIVVALFCALIRTGAPHERASP